MARRWSKSQKFSHKWTRQNVECELISFGSCYAVIHFHSKYAQITTGESLTSTPLAVFSVKRGNRYRFRLVNAMGLSCPAELTIKGHSLLVFATDSNNIQPVNVTSLISSPGERYDFVINANQPDSKFSCTKHLFSTDGSCF